MLLVLIMEVSNKIKTNNMNKYFKSLSTFGIVLLLSLVSIDSVYATALDKAQTSKSCIVDMFEVLP